MSQGTFDFDVLRRDGRPAGWNPSEPPDLSGVSTLGFDTETTGLCWWTGDRPVGTSVATPDGRSWYLPHGHRGGGNLPEETVRRWAREQLREKHLVGSHTVFDAHQYREWGVDLVAQGCTFGDVGHQGALLDEYRRSYGLEALSQDYLGEGKVTGLSGARMADYPAWQVEPYARRDAELALRLDAHFQPLLASEGLLEVLKIEEDLIPVVCEMEANGAPIDVEKLSLWDVESAREVAELEDLVRALCGRVVNPDSPADLERLFSDLKIPITTWTDETKRRPSFTDAVVRDAAKRSPAVAAVRRLGKLRDLRSKYIRPYVETVGADGKVRYALNQLRGDEAGTVSGRLSCSAPAGPGSGVNAQQVITVEKQGIEEFGPEWDIKTDSRRPRYMVRDLYVPAPGQLFLSADAKQIEFRIFVHLSGSERLIARYREDPETDFHAIVMDVVKRYAPDIKRKRLKVVNFTSLFGGGVGKIGDQLGIPFHEARELKDIYDASFPEARQTLRAAAETAKKRGFVRTLAGRRARFRPCPKHGWEPPRGPDGKPRGCPACPRLHKALNSADQGSAADIMKRKLAELYRERKRLGFTMRMTVHDEVTGDVPDAEAARGVGEVLDRQTTPIRVPILWDTKISSSWAGCS